MFLLFLFIICYLIPHLSISFNPCSLITLLVSAIVPGAICTGLLSRWTGSLFFLAYWLQWPSRLFFPLLSLRPCIARLVLEATDWLTVGPIDPQGRAGIDKLSHYAIPPTFHHLLPSFFTYLVFSYSSSLSLSALLNLSLTLFHFQSPPLSHLSAQTSIHPLFQPSLLRPLALSFIDAAEIDAEDNGQWASRGACKGCAGLRALVLTWLRWWEERVKRNQWRVKWGGNVAPGREE